jgi:hypothetical protein
MFVAITRNVNDFYVVNGARRVAPEIFTGKSRRLRDEKHPPIDAKFAIRFGSTVRYRAP